jgi:hypothetical protein
VKGDARGPEARTCYAVQSMTQSERQEAFFAKAERAHRAAMDQLRQDNVYGSASTWREAYMAAFTTYWFMDELPASSPALTKPAGTCRSKCLTRPCHRRRAQHGRQ